MKKLSGKTALVTGASRGMGRASALALAGAGAQVLVHYSSGVKEAEAVVAEIRKAGGRADTIAADLSAPDGAHKLAKQVRGAAGIQRVIIRRLRPIPGGPNWKPADVLPQPDLVLIGEVRAALTDLPSLYALEDERT